jgi:transcriptional regulator with XRE-family HTH domain
MNILSKSIISFVQSNSRNELAQAIGVHVSNISRYDRGERPASDVFSKLANALNVTANYMMDRSVNDKVHKSEVLINLHRKYPNLTNT